MGITEFLAITAIYNTCRLDVEGMKQLLLKINFIREDLGLQERIKAREIRSE